MNLTNIVTIEKDDQLHVADNGGASMSVSIGPFRSTVAIMGEPEDLIRLSVSIREGVRRIIEARDVARVGGYVQQKEA